MLMLFNDVMAVEHVTNINDILALFILLAVGRCFDLLGQNIASTDVNHRTYLYDVLSYCVSRSI